MWVSSAFAGLALAATPVILAPMPVPSLDPLSPWGPAEQLLHSLVHERIFHPTRDGFRSVLVNETVQNGTEATLRLRKGQRWHDGEAIDASDLCFTINALLDPTVHSAWSAMAKARIASCLTDALDPLVARVVLWAPTPVERALCVPLLPEHAYAGSTRGDPRVHDHLAVGSGPYRAERSPAGWSLTAAGPAPFRALDWASVADPHVAANALLAGHGLAVPWVPPSATDALRNAGVGLFPWDRHVAWTLALDANRAPYDAVEVRQAVDALIDRDVLARAIAGGVAGPSPDWPRVSGPFLFDGERHNQGVPPRAHDPLLAATLLQSQGFSRGLDGQWTRDDEPLKLVIGVPTGLGFAPEAVALALLGSGIELEIVPIGPQAWLSGALAGGQTGHVHALLVPRDLFPTDDPAPWVHSRTEREGWFNPFNVHSSDIDTLVIEARGPNGLQAARALHGALADQSAFLFLFEERRRTAWRGTYQPWMPEAYDGWSRIREWKQVD